MAAIPGRSPITTHVLDTARGVPAEGVPIVLEYQTAEQEWLLLGSGATDSDGRLGTLLAPDYRLEPGLYRLTFQTDAYFAGQNLSPAFYPLVSVLFRVADEGRAHYHIPLLLSPFGYSTYRGS